MKNAAIIGISHYARQHLLLALEQALQGRLRLVAATIVNQAEERFFCDRLRRLGCEIFASTDAMWSRFAGRIDLCFIPTGIHFHAPMTLEALRAGASVLVEKPLATTVGDAEEVRRVERETGRFVAVGFQDLYADSTWALKRTILEGGIGRLRRISFVGLWPRPTSYYRRNEWAGRMRAADREVRDSPVNNAFAHFLNLALFWAGGKLETSGSVQRVQGEQYRVHAIESFDTCCFRAQLENHVELLAYATHCSHENRAPRLRLEGTGGQVEWVQESHYEIVDRRGRRTRHPVPDQIETKLMMGDALLARFEDPGARICGTGIALQHVRLVEQLHTGSPIIDIPAKHVQRRRTPAGEWLEIDRIEQVIDESAERGRLWSEMKVPWAQRIVSLPPAPAAERRPLPPRVPKVRARAL